MAPQAVAIVGIVVAGVAVSVAIKEFVYEPYIAPRLEQWAEDFLAARQARKMQRSGVLVSSTSDLSNSKSVRRPDSPSVELETLVSRDVELMSNASGQGELRKRRVATNAHSLDESNPFLSYEPMHPTHVVASSISSTSSTPSLHDRPLHSRVTSFTSQSVSSINSVNHPLHDTLLAAAAAESADIMLSYPSLPSPRSSSALSYASFPSVSHDDAEDAETAHSFASLREDAPTPLSPPVYVAQSVTSESEFDNFDTASHDSWSSLAASDQFAART